jgi:hypothetical protein
VSVLPNMAVFPTPTLTAPSPGSGGVGSRITLTGTYLSSAMAVAFNGTAARFTVNAPTQLTATVPPGATTGPVTVTTPGGTANGLVFVVGPLATASAQAGPRSLTAFPNPASATLTLSGAGPGTPVQLFDAQGRLVANTLATATGTAHVTLPAGLSPGLYVVRSGAQVRRLAIE